MATDSDKYDEQLERESRHSALEELKRDERRPALILLSALLLAAIFFALGIMVGRWTTQTKTQTPATQTNAPPPPASNTAPPQQQPSNTQAATSPTASTSSPTPARPQDQTRRFSLVIENLSSERAAESLVKSLERMGYRDVRSTAKTQGSQFSVLVGHYTREEAEAEARKLRDRGGPRLKDVRVREEADGARP
ncbi:MAG TPA: SPOR domain-containing protein [Pyrinomonadaceae bacterium]|jgi:cytoskeletal protein RodZ|nr:SPOR domain-containing protein [Pyrinomonadaceae bacterium]